MLADKTAIITGASRGIGRAIARLFAQNNANLVITARSNPDLLEELGKALKDKYGISVVARLCDVSDYEAVKSFYKALSDQKIVPDILVNNAGIMRDSMLMMAKQNDIDETIDTNLKGTIYNCQFAVKKMIRKKGGVIINICSVIGLEGNKGQSVYSASKSGLVGFTKSLSKELGRFNIRVNGIAPGFIDTDLTADYDETLKKEVLANISLGRPGIPEDVAQTALFLASGQSVYMSGEILKVDGNMRV